MDHLTDNGLLVELRARKDWLRDNATGMAASTTKRRIRDLERELERRGVDVAAQPRSTSPRSGRSTWYVTSGGRCRHHDRDCLHLADSKVREATEDERENLPICSTCS